MKRTPGKKYAVAGRSLSLLRWSREAGIPYGTFYYWFAKATKSGESNSRAISYAMLRGRGKVAT